MSEGRDIAQRFPAGADPVTRTQRGQNYQVGHNEENA